MLSKKQLKYLIKTIKDLIFEKKLILIVLIMLSLEMFFPHHLVKAAEATQSKREITIQKYRSILELPRNSQLTEEISNYQPIKKVKRTIYITVTAYSSTRAQTDSTPCITGSGTHVRDGVVAANFLPIGTRVRLPDKFGDKEFIVEDRMNRRYWRRMDIWMEEYSQAKQFGRQYLKVEILE